MVIFRRAPQAKTSGSRRLIAATLSTMILLTSCGGSKQVRFSSLFKEDDELTADIAFKVVEKSYRIKPDRRYLLAFSDISTIVTGKPLEKVEAVFVDGKWQIKSDKKVLSEINNFPTFQDTCNSLVNYARSLEGEQGQNRFPSNGKTVLNMAKIYGAFETQTQIVYGESTEAVKQPLTDKSPETIGSETSKTTKVSKPKEVTKPKQVTKPNQEAKSKKTSSISIAPSAEE